MGPEGWRFEAARSRSASLGGRTGTRTWAGPAGKTRAARLLPNEGCAPALDNSRLYIVPFSGELARLRVLVALPLHFVPFSGGLLGLLAPVALRLVAMRRSVLGSGLLKDVALSPIEGWIGRRFERGSGRR